MDDMNFLESIGLIAIGIVLIFIIELIAAKKHIRIAGKLGCLPYLLILMGLYFLVTNIWSGISHLFDKSTPPISIQQSTPVGNKTKISSTTAITMGCSPWNNIPINSVGYQICIYGNVEKISQTDTLATLISFTSSQGKFYLFDEDHVYPDLEKGDCVSASAILKVDDKNIPYMSVNQLYHCESWMN